MSTIEKALKKQAKNVLDENVVPIREEVIQDSETSQQEDDSTTNDIGFEREQLSESTIGEILIKSDRLSEKDVDLIHEVQRDEGVYFGEAALKLKLIKKEDIEYALCKQYGYTYIDPKEDSFSKELITLFRPFHKKSEVFRLIRSQLVVGPFSEEKHIIAVVSPGEQEGKTYIASNLAVTMAQLGKRTLLIDANFRTPRINDVFSINSRIGLSSMLAGRVSRENLSQLPYSVDSIPNLFVLTTGALPPHPGELLGSHVLPKILNEISTFYDAIILDTPPGRYLSDVQAVSHAAGQAMVVLKKNISSMHDSKKLIEALRHAKVDVFGTILNN